MMNNSRHVRTAVLAMLAVISLHGSAAAQTEKAAPRVVIAPVTEKSLPLELDYIGNIRPVQSAEIKARVMGHIMSYHFREGEDVEKDQLLFTIDQRPYEAKLNTAKASLKQHQAELEFAKEEVARYSKLVDKGFVARETYDLYRRDVAVKESLVRSDEATIRRAELDMEYSAVKAPFAGRAGRRLVDPGNFVMAGGSDADTILVVINQIDPIKVEFAVPQPDLQPIRKAHGATPLALQVALGGDGETTHDGTLWLIDNQIDTGTGMILLHGMVDNPDHTLWPGQLVNVRVKVGTASKTLSVPSAAVFRGQQGPYVFTVGPDSKLEKQLVTLGRTLGHATIVTAGLKAGQHVVVEGSPGLQSGMVVQADGK